MSISITNLERSLLFRRFLSAFDEPQADILADTLGLIAGQIRGEFATREDIQDLKESIRELAEAQARTEETLRKYQEASEARFARIEAALDRLAEAQARMEERVTRLEEAVARLAEAQARTEAQIRELAEAQARTEEEFRKYREASEARFARIEAALDRLAEAQARTERKVDKLAQQVGGLSETVGGDIEDIAYIVIHKVLQREKGWQVGELKRVWQEWDGRKREVNIFGEARDPARPEQRIWIVGEAKHNLTLREVEKFARIVEIARRNLQGEIFPVCFCYRARPEVQERIQELGFSTVFSYGELVEPRPRGDSA